MLETIEKNGCLDRINSHLKEIVVNSYSINAEHLLPPLGEEPFQLTPRGRILLARFRRLERRALPLALPYGLKDLLGAIDLCGEAAEFRFLVH